MLIIWHIFPTKQNGTWSLNYLRLLANFPQITVMTVNNKTKKPEPMPVAWQMSASHESLKILTKVKLPLPGSAGNGSE